MADQFLSHLCGGEAPTAGRLALRIFLSHLCGGEDDLLDDKGRVDFSKPPMRW